MVSRHNRSIFVNMNRLVSRQLLSVAKLAIAPRQFSVLSHNRASSTPLIEHYRSAWPDVLKDKPSAEMPEFPKRTVPDDLLRFSFTANFDAGGAFFYPHLKTNPADFKVRMKDLPLNPREREIFARMVGKRLRVGNGELQLTADKFPNRMENRKYLVFLLENLIVECKKLHAMQVEIGKEKKAVRKSEHADEQPQV